MKKRILTELELNLAKMEQGMATIERQAAMGDPLAKQMIEPLTKQISHLRDSCRAQLEHVIRESDDPELINVATEALWRFMAHDQHTSHLTH